MHQVYRVVDVGTVLLKKHCWCWPMFRSKLDSPIKKVEVEGFMASSTVLLRWRLTAAAVAYEDKLTNDASFSKCEPT